MAVAAGASPKSRTFRLSPIPSPEAERKAAGNPFRRPGTAELIGLKEREKAARKQERELMSTLSVPDKGTLLMQKQNKIRRRASLESDMPHAATLAAPTRSHTSLGSYTTPERVPPFVGSRTAPLPARSRSVEPSSSRTPLRSPSAQLMDSLALKTRNRTVQNQSLNDYVQHKRDLFMQQYTITVKQDEIEKLRTTAENEEERLARASQQLEEDARRFETHLQDNDRAAMEAIRAADGQAKIKQQRNDELKRLTTEVAAAKDQIAKCEDRLHLLHLYRNFLYHLSPKEWLDEQLAKIADHRRERLQAVSPALSPTPTPAPTAAPRLSRPQVSAASLPMPAPRKTAVTFASSAASAASRRGPPTRRSSQATLAPPVASGPPSPGVEAPPGTPEPVSPLAILEEDVDADEDVDSALFFTSPGQLLQMFHELEEDCLFRITLIQEVEATLQLITETTTNERAKIEQERGQMIDRVETLERALADQIRKAQKLKQFYDFMVTNHNEQEEAEIDGLIAKVSQVYSSVLGENEASINEVQMLANIESLLDTLTAAVDAMPADLVEKAQEERDRARRLRARDEKLAAQKRHQEERLRMHQLRAQAMPKRKTGKKLMFRSAPPKAQVVADDAKRLARHKSRASMVSYDLLDEFQTFFM
eukprot:m.253871 g.253871  ORF g.253871 m.253871 type:complete len:650 (+) comp18577_c0_seq1:339-2288(+)